MSDVANEESVLKNAAISLLARREHSQKELMDKLSRRSGDTGKIKHLVDELSEQGLQSETRFIEAFIGAKKSSGKGPKYIKQELRRRGVSEFLVASYVYEGDDEWLALAAQVYAKKFGENESKDGKERARRFRFMVSRGFSSECVMQLLPSH